MVRVAVCLCAAACRTPDEPACTGEGGAPALVATLAIGDGELSGLAASHSVAGLLWAEDDGGAAEVYSVDDAGRPHGTLRLDGVTPIDWEDIATGPCPQGTCIYVADTGDNDLARPTVALYEVVEPASNPVGVLAVAWQRYAIRFADAAHDMEAVFVDPRDGMTYGIEKVEGKAATVFRLPRDASAVTTAEPIGTFTPPSGDDRVTAADLVVDDCAVRLAIRTRNRLFELRGDPGQPIGDLVTATAHELPVADEPQGESIAYRTDGRAYFTVSEGESPPLWRVDVQ